MAGSCVHYLLVSDLFHLPVAVELVGLSDADVNTVLASHPPLFGFAGSMSLIGFTYGIWPGFLIASIASMLGAALAFLSVRVRSALIPSPGLGISLADARLRLSSQRSRWAPSGMRSDMS